MLICMRTTLNIDDRLMVKAKTAAAQRGVTLTQLVEDSLRANLLPKPAQSRYKLNWTTCPGKLVPGVNINSREALFDYLDAHD